jgi:hypothetical protein
MAGRGPVPGFGAKPPGQRRRRNRETPRLLLGAPPDEWPALPWDGASEQTQEWYRTWATSRQASQFTPTDWLRLHELAPIVDAFYAAVMDGRVEKDAKDLMSEIRLNEALLGATILDRMRLRWDLVAAPEAEDDLPRRRMRPKLKVIDGGANARQAPRRRDT